MSSFRVVENGVSGIVTNGEELVLTVIAGDECHKLGLKTDDGDDLSSFILGKRNVRGKVLSLLRNNRLIQCIGWRTLLRIQLKTGYTF